MCMMAKRPSKRYQWQFLQLKQGRVLLRILSDSSSSFLIIYKKNKTPRASGFRRKSKILNSGFTTCSRSNTTPMKIRTNLNSSNTFFLWNRIVHKTTTNMTKTCLDLSFLLHFKEWNMVSDLIWRPGDHAEHNHVVWSGIQLLWQLNAHSAVGDVLVWLRLGQTMNDRKRSEPPEQSTCSNVTVSKCKISMQVNLFLHLSIGFWNPDWKKSYLVVTGMNLQPPEGAVGFVQDSDHVAAGQRCGLVYLGLLQSCFQVLDGSCRKGEEHSSFSFSPQGTLLQSTAFCCHDILTPKCSGDFLVSKFCSRLPYNLLHVYLLSPQSDVPRCVQGVHFMKHPTYLDL